MTLQNLLVPFVPRRVTPAQALAAARILRAAADAIWQVHGEEMLSALARECRPVGPTGERLDEDDLPF